MLHRTELLYAAVSAMVVGYKKSLGRYDFSRTSASELHDGILEGRVVDVIDLLWSELAAKFLHCLAVHLLQQRKHPHAFIRHDAAGKYRHGREKT